MVPPVSYNLPCVRFCFPLIYSSVLPLICCPLSVRIHLLPSTFIRFLNILFHHLLVHNLKPRYHPIPLLSRAFIFQPRRHHANSCLSTMGPLKRGSPAYKRKLEANKERDSARKGE